MNFYDNDRNNSYLLSDNGEKNLIIFKVSVSYSSQSKEIKIPLTRVKYA